MRTTVPPARFAYGSELGTPRMPPRCSVFSTTLFDGWFGGGGPVGGEPNRSPAGRGWSSGFAFGRLEAACGSPRCPVGAIALGEAPDYAPPAPEPELYIQGFVTDRRYRGQGIGDALLTHARAEAIRSGVHLLRVDCWAGGDQALVRYYERAGFTAAQRITVGDKEVQILHQRC
jgi:GNAT superfamily N-acetyltransferase